MKDRTSSRLSRRRFLHTAGGTLAAVGLTSPRAEAQVPNIRLPEPPGK